MTRVYCYGKGSKRGLIVVEGKKRSSEDKNLYAITVAQYYAISHENICNQNKINVGLSMIVHIHVLNDSFNYTVKGPDQHPSSALFYMIDQVYKSGSWKLASCPHCAGEPQGCQSIEVKQNDDDILRTNLVSFPTYKQLSKSTNYQSQPYDFYQRSRSSPESRLYIRNLNFPTSSAPHHGRTENKRLELIDNKDINGNGNGNRIEGDQKFILSIPLYFGKRKILQSRAKA
ncbi:uncharacterized protein LOC123884195 [Trifolium pratense]|uniref:uncharacterized protein LOC123884195 n=1 Tax=Trifolium pratense TaxID=57577 RepID=UPI001E69276E|nr:uncharacterized protein LOC123884195 [Trifolium pratense]